MTHDQAVTEFLALVRRYGPHWNHLVPRAAYDRMAEVNKVLSTEDKRKALGMVPR